MSIKLIRRGEVWYLRGTVAGASVYESTGLRDRRKAEALRIRREAEILERHALGRTATATFGEAALTYMRAGGEARYLGPILEHFGPKKRLVDVDNEAVNEAAAALYPTAAPATVNRQLITPIAAVMKMAAEDGLVERRSFRRRPTPKGRLRWLTPEEAETLLEAAADHRTMTLIAMLLGTGCRIGELLQMQISDLYLDTCEAWVWRSKTERRMVRYPIRVREALVKLIAGRDAGAVFLTPKGLPYKLHTGSGGQAAATFNKARDAAGLDDLVTPHTCRHTWATWFHAVTKDFGALIDLGGWSKADTANIYRKVAPRDLAGRVIAHGWNFADDETSAKSVQGLPGSELKPQISIVK